MAPWTMDLCTVCVTVVIIQERGEREKREMAFKRSLRKWVKELNGKKKRVRFRLVKKLIKNWYTVVWRGRGLNNLPRVLIHSFSSINFNLFHFIVLLSSCFCFCKWCERLWYLCVKVKIRGLKYIVLVYKILSLRKIRTYLVGKFCFWFWDLLDRMDLVNIYIPKRESWKVNLKF